MKRLMLLVLYISIGFGAFAQQKGRVSGRVVDTLNRQPVQGVTITVLKKADSSLVSFTMSSQDGSFELSGLTEGEYRLLITHIRFHHLSRFFNITGNQPHVNTGDISLTDKYTTLNEVLVQAEAPPVTIKEDTVEYNAGSFKTVPNANVEDLLKKLPGVKVEKDGTVKAQGQKVNRVYVDGKEFFGNDPKMATRNLPADAVDKVQVYDRMSDQAQLTGFDDGNSEKAINLKLKKDKKKGLFGKAMAGAGTEGRYEGRFNVNSFKGARQMSVIGMGNNTNAEGFSFMDMLNFSGELSRMTQGGNISVNITSDDAGPGAMSLGSRNNGINTTWAGGVNYNDLIGTKLDFRSNYFYNRFSPKSETELERQYFLPDSSYFYKQQGITETVNNSHRLNLVMDYAIDSLHSIRISPSLGYQQTQTASGNRYQTLSGNYALTNDGFSNNLGNNQGYNFRNDLLFRKKFSRKGRTLSLALQNMLNESEGDGSQESVNRFYDPAGINFRTDSINQRSNTESDLKGYTARMVYTEPVFKRAILEFSAAKSDTRSISNRKTFNYNKGTGKFDDVNELLSNDFENRYGYTNAGIRFRKQYRKFNWAVGAAWQQAELQGKVMLAGKDSTIRKSFQNILPNARFQYQFNRFSSLTLNYQTITNQPAVSQLQPVPDISNPLSIRLGNPDLKQEYTGMAQLNYMRVNPVNNKNFFVFGTFRYTGNRIVNSDSVTSLGVKYSRPVNVSGVYTANGDINWGIPLKFIKRSSINFGMQVAHSKGKQFINGEANRISDWRLVPEMRLELNPTDKLNISASLSTVYNYTDYSLQPALKARYFTHGIGTEMSWQLPVNFLLATDFDYLINARRADGYNVNVPLWNASVSKFFMKYNRGQLSLRVFDLLNQNVGITRTSNNNYIEDRRVTILRRFFQLSFTFSLSKSGLNAGGGGGNIRIISR